MQAADIISALPEKFKSASEQILFPSTVYKHQDIGLEVRCAAQHLDAVSHLSNQFELRLCTTLQKKPVERDAAGHLSLSPESGSTAKDPFAAPYTPHLYLGELSLQDRDEVSDYVVLVRAVVRRLILES